MSQRRSPHEVLTMILVVIAATAVWVGMVYPLVRSMWKD